MMNISPILNSVKCTVFGRFAQFWDVLEGSTAYGTSPASRRSILLFSRTWKPPLWKGIIMNEEEKWMDFFN